MSILSRFFGNKGKRNGKASDETADALGAQLNLMLLFPAPIVLNADDLIQRLRAYDSALANAAVELDPELSAEGFLVGQAKWGPHVINILGFNAPMPPPVVEKCVQPAHYSQDLKQKARDHKAHILLTHIDTTPSPLERYVALAALAAAFEPAGAFMVLNESAHTSLPINILNPDQITENRLDYLRALPLPMLYAGFVKHDVEGVAGVWMRTYGCELMGVPNLAKHAPSHGQGSQVLEQFSQILSYSLHSKVPLQAGHTMQVGADSYIRYRAPRRTESFLQSDSVILILEDITERQIND